MFISLIIPTYNRENPLVECLKCAFNQKEVNYEVIVVDQTRNHDAETKAFLDNNQNKMTYIFSEIASVTNARNLGISKAKGDIIVFIDDDTTFAEDFLKHHLEGHKFGDMVGGRIIEEGSIINPQGPWLTPWIKFTGSDTSPHERFTNTITGCNFSFKRHVYEKIGGFDTNFTGISVREDSEFGYRAYKNGFKIFFYPKAELFHHRLAGGVDTGIGNMFFNISYYTCELYFAKKHFAWPAILNYKLRLSLRGLKGLRKLIREADRKSNTIFK